MKMMDGSMSEALKVLGFDASEHSPHWTFEANRDAELIRRVYGLFLDAGVDVITTNTYHYGSTFDEGLRLESIDRRKYDGFFETACVELKRIVAQNNGKHVRILGSCGTLATRFHNCSEYNGSFAELDGISAIGIAHFDSIFAKFLEMGINDLIVETVSTNVEVTAILEVLRRHPAARVVISFTLRENGKLRHGEDLKDVVRRITRHAQIIGVGINCTDIENVLDGLKSLREFEFNDVFVYPNIGDDYFSRGSPRRESPFTPQLLQTWAEHGATVVGGCCGIGCGEIRKLRGIIDDVAARRNK